MDRLSKATGLQVEFKNVHGGVDGGVDLTNQGGVELSNHFPINLGNYMHFSKVRAKRVFQLNSTCSSFLP